MSTVGSCHSGLCVTDIEQAQEAWMGALGFKQAESYKADDI